MKRSRLFSEGERERAKDALYFWIKFNIENGCWEWLGAVDTFGRGRITFSRRKHLAHRFAYEAFIGPVPEGKLLCHKCDNPRCCNPMHLFIGTHKDNTQDMIRKGRAHWQKASKAV